MDDILKHNLGGAPGMGNFKTIDNMGAIVAGRATSIKSPDLGRVSYADPRALERTLNRYVDRLAEFSGGTRTVTSRDGVTRSFNVQERAIKSRELILAIPSGVGTRDQLGAINSVIQRAGRLKNPVLFSVQPYR